MLGKKHLHLTLSNRIRKLLHLGRQFLAYKGGNFLQLYLNWERMFLDIFLLLPVPNLLVPHGPPLMLDVGFEACQNWLLLLQKPPHRGMGILKNGSLQLGKIRQQAFASKPRQFDGGSIILTRFYC
jgi:hypothetical protein